MLSPTRKKEEGNEIVGATPRGLPMDAPKGLSDLTLTLSYEEGEVICRGDPPKADSPMGWGIQPLHSDYLSLVLS